MTETVNAVPRTYMHNHCAPALSGLEDFHVCSDCIDVCIDVDTSGGLLPGSSCGCEPPGSHWGPRPMNRGARLVSM
eukprot:6292981-Amphidinium_carterae.1